MHQQRANILISGASGLIGSEVAIFSHSKNFFVHGIDNNQRAIFFGPQGDTRWSRPITWRNRRTGVAKLKIKEMGSRYLFICLYIWLEKYLARGDYIKR